MKEARDAWEPGSPEHVAVWDAINDYAIACGGDPSKHVYGNLPRMDAVARVEATMRRLARQSGRAAGV